MIQNFDIELNWKTKSFIYIIKTSTASQNWEGTKTKQTGG